MTGERRAIVMVSMGERPWLDHTAGTFARYAASCSATMHVEREAPSASEFPFPDMPDRPGRRMKRAYACKVFFAWKYLEYHGYDRVMIVDDTCCVRAGTPDAFALVPPGACGITRTSNSDREAADAFDAIGFLARAQRLPLVKASAVRHLMHWRYRAAEIPPGIRRRLHRLRGREWRVSDVIDGAPPPKPARVHTREGEITLDPADYLNSGVVLYDREMRQAIHKDRIAECAPLLYSTFVEQPMVYYLLKAGNVPLHHLPRGLNVLPGESLPPTARHAIRDMAPHLADGGHIYHVTSAYRHRDELIGSMGRIFLDEWAEAQGGNAPMEPSTMGGGAVRRQPPSPCGT